MISKDGSKISGNARKEIESKMGKRVATAENFLEQKKKLPAKRKGK